jgi:MFS family permease
MFDALRERDYRRFWITQFISNIGSWMQGVAQGWLVYRLTDSPFLLGFVGFSYTAPAIVLMLPGGVLADQLDRRKVLRVSQWVQTLTALALSLAIYTGTIAVWQIIVASLINGTAMAFSSPAYQAMVVDLLDDRAHLPNAIAMNSLQFNLSRALGPLLAGVTLAAWGNFWCFFLNAISFLPLIHVLGTIRDRQQRAVSAEAMLTRLAAGFRYVRGERLVLILLGIMMSSSLFGYPVVTLLPMLARGAADLGWLMGAFGIGALLSALALAIRLPALERMPRVIAVALTLFGAALFAIPFARSAPLLLALLVAAGAAMVTCYALINTSIQQRTPDAMRGRVMSMYTYSFFAFLPLGNLFAGTLAEHAGLPRTLMLYGVLLALTAAGAVVGGGRVVGTGVTAAE